jgi:hypothetical protein
MSGPGVQRVEPCVKGALVVGAVVSIRRHRDGGRITPEQLEVRLSEEALELVDRKIDIGRWYPVRPFCELIDLDWELASGRDPEYARKAGSTSADRLFDRGIYHQLEYAERAERVQTRADLVRQAKRITAITATLYNFLDFEVRVDERARCLEIHYRKAAPFAEILRYTTEGFMNQINRRQKSERRWSSERLSPDAVVFRLPLPSRLAGES